jgi:hypothetical protein
MGLSNVKVHTSDAVGKNRSPEEVAALAGAGAFGKYGTGFNRAPQVVPGPDQTISLPGSAHLAAVVTDDGLPAGSTLAHLEPDQRPWHGHVRNVASATTNAASAPQARTDSGSRRAMAL